jgi:hypothetical protein
MRLCTGSTEFFERYLAPSGITLFPAPAAEARS